jgi:hypothetical protein
MSAASDLGIIQAPGCGSAMQGVDRAKADLGIDRNIMSRTRSLVDAAKQSGQAPPPAQVANVTEDSLDSLEDAAGQMDSTAQDIGHQLEALKLTRQARTWGHGVTNLQSARTQFKSAMTKQGWGGKGTRIQATSGVGPQWTSTAADSVSQSATELDAIGKDAQLQEIGQKNWIEQGAADKMPPPNPRPDPLQEALARMRAQMARINANARALNAIQGMAAHNAAQAAQGLANGDQQLAQAADALKQLEQLLSPCMQPNNNTQNRPNNTSNTGNAPNAATATTAATGGGMGAGTAAVVGLGLAGGATAVVYKVVQGQSCGPEPDFMNGTYNSCLNASRVGNCSGARTYCAAWLSEFGPWIECMEKKHPEAAGVSAALRDTVRELLSETCLVPPVTAPNYSPVTRR